MNYIPTNYLPTNYLPTNYLPTNYMSSNYNPNNDNNKSIPLNLNIKLGIMILFTYIVINGMSKDIKNSIKKEFTKHTITRDKLFSLLYKKLLVVPFIVSFYWAIFNIVLKVIYHLINQLLFKPKKCNNNNNTTDNKSNNNNDNNNDNNSTDTTDSTSNNNAKTNKKSLRNSISNMANKTKENFTNKLQDQKGKFRDLATDAKSRLGDQKGKLTGLARDATSRLLKGGVDEVNNNTSKKEELTLNLYELLFQGIMNDILLLMYITIFNIILISIINVLMVLPAKDNEIDENGLDNIFLVYKISYILSFLLLYMQINLQ
tara:strand:- start:2349 stop:3299 length:951 start_codon:yes stop_codon:yes gene_type:complete